MMGSCHTKTVFGLSGGRIVLPLVFVWALIGSTAAQSAILENYPNPDKTIEISLGSFQEFVTSGNLEMDPALNWAVTVIGGDDINTEVVKIRAEPNNLQHDVEFTLLKVSSHDDFLTDTDTGTFVAAGTNSMTALFLAGMDYVLQIDCFVPCRNARIGIGDASAVPLPAAAWLFGSALIGFIMMSNRRSV